MVHLIALAILTMLVSPLSSRAADYCFDFRATAGYVTDPSGCVPIYSTSIYAASPGYGWIAFTNGNDRDRNAYTGNQAVLAGINFIDNLATRTFQIDLTAGTYDIRYALGDYSAGHGAMTMVLKDGGSTIDTLSAVTTTGGAYWYDAGHTQRTSAADWESNNTALQVTLSSGTFTFELSSPISGDAVISHFRITTAAAANSTHNLMLMGVGQ